jgi:hypothetical protein
MEDEWENDIRARFHDWGSQTALSRWPAVRSSLTLGQTVVGNVIARAPFGVWIDIGVSFPALLLVTRMEGARQRRITFDDYPQVGTVIDGRLVVLGEGGEIGITQLDPSEEFSA